MKFNKISKRIKLKRKNRLKKKNNRTTASLKISLLVILTLINTQLISKYHFSNNNSLENLNSSEFLVLTNPIVIDDSNAQNWSWAATQEWCSGYGNYSQPYLIENLQIDGGKSQSCIEIRNSNVYFNIRNCTLFNSGTGSSPMFHAGVKLYNVSNGKIINNNCSNNIGVGIALYKGCHNNTLSGNTANDNSHYGISLFKNCNYNNISGNTVGNVVIFCQDKGIYLHDDCNYNTISGNTANDNYYTGISLFKNCSDNTLLGNNAGNVVSSFRQDLGISLHDDCNNNTISDNNANNNYDYGIYLENECNNNTILGNTVKHNSDSGICLWSSCDNNNISGNTANSNYFYGISLNYDCNNNTISGNMENYNSHSGIYLRSSCDNNNISGNTANYNSDSGIHLFNNCNNNNISGNTANDNHDYGIYLRGYCNESFISGNNASNVVSDNQDYGIYFFGNCHNNTISDNNANDNNDYGIYLYNNCTYNSILNNIVINNTYYGIYIQDNCNNITILRNIINRNTYYGIFLNNSIRARLLENQLFETGLYVEGSLSFLKTHEINSSNLMNGKPIYYYVDKKGLSTINFHNAGQIILINCSNSLISGVNVSYTSIGIFLHTSSHNVISKNTATNNSFYGIYLYNNCNNNTISGNTVNDNLDHGIVIYDYCNDNNISGNIVSDNTNYGIYLYNNCNNNTLSENTASNLVSKRQNYGIFLYKACNNNIISGNTVNNNTNYGIYIREYCNENTISENMLNNNFDHGIFLFNSSNVKLFENRLFKTGLYVEGSLSVLRTLEINTSNLMNEKLIYYYVDEKGLEATDFHNGGQIILINCSNSLISGVNVSYTSIGIFLYTSSHNTILKNTATNNSFYGIYLYNECNNNTILGNTVKYNSDSGICLWSSCDNNNILGNTVNKNYFYGISLNYDCNNNTISGNTANYNSGSGICLSSSCDNNNISGNTANYNSGSGIFLYGGCNENFILGNTANNNSGGIYLRFYCNENTLSENNANNNKNFGIYLGFYCNENTLSENNASHNTESGIELYKQSNNNKVSRNTVNDNTGCGIYLKFYCNENTLSENNASHNTESGIYLYYRCNENKIAQNIIEYNLNCGIKLAVGSDNNTILGNEISNNNYSGLYIRTSSNKNKISQNFIKYNPNRGMVLVGSDENMIYNNFFIKNGINAEDNGTSNQWDNGIMGNYWHNYTGSDSDCDGIGDTPYNISGSAGTQDNYPLIDTIPIVDFEANLFIILEGDSIQFTYNGFGGNIPLTYFWNFGDGANSTDQNPQHQYNTAGTYTVSLSIIDLNMNSSIKEKADYILVLEDLVPEASFIANTTETLTGQSIQFTFMGSEGNPDAKFYWDFGDGTDSTNQNPQHQYFTAENYTVSLTVTDTFGEKDTKQIFIVIHENLIPNAYFIANATEILMGQSIQFTFMGSEGDPDAKFYWDFGDGTNSTDQNPQHQYFTAGNYTVSLTVTDAYGEIDTKQIIIVVMDPSNPSGNNPLPNEFLFWIIIGIVIGIFGSIAIITIVIVKKRIIFR